jgi:GntR family transcriptional regulator/MocR family aminotransferase
VAAYEHLIAEGRLQSRRGSGTVVAPAPAVVPPPAAPRSDLADVENLPLRPGLPDLSLFPRVTWRRSYERALSAATDAELGYGDPAGAPRLRAEMAAYLGRVRAARLGPDDLVMTTGAAQAFAILAELLRSEGARAVALEDPGSPGIRGHLSHHGLELVPVPVDADGLDVAALERTRVPAVLVTPAHQFPTGVLLAPARRAALVDWARRTGGLIIEDDYDAEFRYDRDPVGCVQGLAPDVVAHLGSVSKALAPALRLGWLAVPPARQAQVRRIKAAADLGGPVLEQLAFAELVAGGGYDRHLRRARRAQRESRDALVAALAKQLPAARVSGIAAGLHLVVELPDGVDDVALAVRARVAGLGPIALSSTRLGPPGPPGLVVGYAAHTPDQLTAAVERLAALMSGET